MGAVTGKHIVVTGAAGYLGRAIVSAAEARGHRVSAITRSGSESIVQDLAWTGAAETLAAKIQNADAVIHAASEMSGDWAVHERSSLPAMRTACALAERLDAHLVHISSIVVYDFAALNTGDIVNEETPIEIVPEQRDAYVRAKLAQEEIVAGESADASVLRVGAIYGPTRILNAHLGVGVGPVLLRLANRGQVPLAHVDMVAEIAVRAAETRASGAVNVLDTDLPDRVRFIETLSASGWPKLVIPLPWQVFSALGSALAFWRSRPGLLRKRVLHARMKPLGYDNAVIRAKFPDVTQPSFETLMKWAMRDG